MLRTFHSIKNDILICRMFLKSFVDRNVVPFHFECCSTCTYYNDIALKKFMWHSFKIQATKRSFWHNFNNLQLFINIQFNIKYFFPITTNRPHAFKCYSNSPSPNIFLKLWQVKFTNVHLTNFEFPYFNLSTPIARNHHLDTTTPMTEFSLNFDHIFLNQLKKGVWSDLQGHVMLHSNSWEHPHPIPFHCY